MTQTPEIEAALAELKPCPFCGCERMPTVTATQKGDDLKFQIVCTCCWIETKGYKSHAELIKFWNTRALTESSEKPRDLEALKYELVEKAKSELATSVVRESMKDIVYSTITDTLDHLAARGLLSPPAPVTDEKAGE